MARTERAFIAFVKDGTTRAPLSSNRPSNQTTAAMVIAAPMTTTSPIHCHQSIPHLITRLRVWLGAGTRSKAGHDFIAVTNRVP